MSCIDCTYLALQQPLRLLCTCDGHNSVMVDGDLALKHLYKECPLKKRGDDMMSEKRYYKKEYEEEYYIFDSKTLSEKEFEEKVEYDGYDVFADSLTPHEVLDLLNENEVLKEENEQLKKELFQSEKECIYEAYADNSVRRDNKIKALEDEFNERFGDDMND